MWMFSNHLFNGSDGSNRKFRTQLVSPLHFQLMLEPKLDTVKLDQYRYLHNRMEKQMPTACLLLTCVMNCIHLNCWAFSFVCKTFDVAIWFSITKIWRSLVPSKKNYEWRNGIWIAAVELWDSARWSATNGFSSWRTRLTSEDPGDNFF